MKEYVTNPKTGRKILVGGPTYNKVFCHQKGRGRKQDSFSNYFFGQRVLPIRIVSLSYTKKGHLSMKADVADSNGKVFTFKTGKKLGSGSFGAVYELASDSGLKLAVKVMPNNAASQEEVYITKLLMGIRSQVLRARIIYEPDGVFNGWVVVMDAMDGSLSDLVKKYSVLSPKDAALVVGQVQEQLVEVYNQDNRLIYRDVKLGNILYKLVNDQKGKKPRVVPVVGDLGSFNNNTTTYMCHENFTPERCVAFQLGILFAQLVGLKVGVFHHSNIMSTAHKDFREKNPTKYAEKYASELDTLHDTIVGMGCPNAASFLARHGSANGFTTPFTC